MFVIIVFVVVLVLSLFPKLKPVVIAENDDLSLVNATKNKKTVKSVRLTNLDDVFVGQQIHLEYFGDEGPHIVSLTITKLTENSDSNQVTARNNFGDYALITNTAVRVFGYLEVASGIYEFDGENFTGTLKSRSEAWRDVVQMSYRPPDLLPIEISEQRLYED